jgi:opacity protein-like surface antigen
MIRLSILVVAAATALTLAGVGASAQTVVTTPAYYAEVYIGSGVGGTTSLSGSIDGASGSLSLDPKAGVFTSVAVGRQLGYGLAAEGEFVYTDNDINTSSIDPALGNASVKTYGGLANIMWAVTRLGPVIPYVGGGVGYGGVRYGLLGYSRTDSGLLAQVKAGLSYPVSKRISLDLGYRYLFTPKDHLLDLYDVGVTTRLHVVTAGVRVRF